MSKTSLDTQTRFLWIIFGRQNSPLTKDFSYYYDKLKAWCLINAELYTYIGHDKDLDENGASKFRHIHALIVLKKGLKPRLSTSLNGLAQLLDIPPQDIDIEKADNITSCIRYCVHRGYPDKYQYEIDELQTNLSREDLDEYLNIQDESCFTANYLINMILLCNCSYITILKQIGIKNYIKYRNIIKDVVQELSA